MGTKKSRKPPSDVQYCLLTIIVKERTGRDIAKEYERIMDRPINYGTLYVELQRMRDAGWIGSRPDPNGDGRTRLFSLKGEGCAALNARRAQHIELARLARGVTA